MFLKLTLWGYGLQSPLNVNFRNQASIPESISHPVVLTRLISFISFKEMQEAWDV